MKNVMTLILMTVVVITAGASANLLVDPGFETNPLTTYTNVLTNFPGFVGQWGDEVSTIVTAENGITPFQGVRMLRMDDDGLTATQTFQSTDVTAFAATIDAGGVGINAIAQYNAHPHLSAALSNITVFFFSAANWGSQIGTPLVSNLILDASPNTWQANLVAGIVPVGTRWMVTQVAYQNASLLGSDGAMYPGYVDAAELWVKVPEPATMGLLALGGLTLLRRRRRQSA
ncbi:MAG: PEP-CTERM sorting domain-containing protein [Planctomycetes bacterium]|nr:PEP-CTERM sorting domain-containing protein [Planctomycetota bacterium]